MLAKTCAAAKATRMPCHGTDPCTAQMQATRQAHVASQFTMARPNASAHAAGVGCTARTRAASRSTAASARAPRV